MCECVSASVFDCVCLCMCVQTCARGQHFMLFFKSLLLWWLLRQGLSIAGLYRIINEREGGGGEGGREEIECGMGL